MAIISTPKGWAIEFELNPDCSSYDFANQYYEFTNGLIDTVQEAIMNKDTTEKPVYYTLQILRALLPSFEQSQLMIEHTASI